VVTGPTLASDHRSRPAAWTACGRTRTSTRLWTNRPVSGAPGDDGQAADDACDDPDPDDEPDDDEPDDDEPDEEDEPDEDDEPDDDAPEDDVSDFFSAGLDAASDEVFPDDAPSFARESVR